ncbi:MAG TPA: DUF1631 family protein [Burkholderiales bacterium]|nr:DUF1631 family protein [Burkholderiales bacterium]
MSGAAQPIDRRAFLNQCRGAVERQLGKELEPLLEALPGQLDELGRQSRDRDERDQYSQASARLARDRDAFFAAFRKEYDDSFETYAKALQGATPPVGTPGRDELAAMKTNVLENEVAVGKLAAKFKEHATAELTELSARVAAMFKRGGLGDGDNPLGPLPIARSVYAGFSALKIEGRAMKAIRGELEKRLPNVVREMYQNANRAFAGLGIEPATGRGAAPAAALAPAPRASDEPSPDALAAAEKAITHALAGTPLPPMLDLFFSQTWVRVVARAHAVGGATWQQTAATTQELVWSLKPKPDPAERAKLVGALPGLLKKVGAAMEAELDADGRKLVFDALMAHHRETLQPAAKPGG